jgi:hypothetical protein
MVIAKYPQGSWKGRTFMKLSQRFITFAATAISAMALMTAAASATNYCDKAEYQQVSAYSGYTKDSHIHLDVACPHDYRAISCEFDVGGKDDYDQNQYFVAINDSSPYKFDSDHNGHKLEGEYGCHFRANNFMPYFPGYHEFDWRLKGTATCVPKACVYVNDTHDYYDESKNTEWEWNWDEHR